MLKFQVTNGQGLWRTDKNIVSADTTDLKAQFELTADFTGTITVWWRRSDVNNTYTSTLAADGTCTIPAEALAATDKAVYGPYDHDVFVSISDTGRTTTNEYKLTVLRSAFSTNATPGTGGSPTAYEELVEQFDELKADNQTFKDNMTEQQETFESTVTENVDNIRYVVETETAPPIIEEASGAEITLDDSAYRQVRGLNLYGYSKQIQTTGAQLIPITEENVKGTRSLTATLNPDGSIKITGMPTERFARALKTNVSLSPGTYHVSGGSDAAGYVVAQVQIIRSTKESWFTNNSFEVQNGDDVSVAIVYNNATLQAVDISSFKPMLNRGSSPLPWEPYSGGVASPSPDWAQPITSVGDGGSVTVNSVGANLFPALDVQDVTAGGVTVRNNNDGSLTISGSGNLTRTISSFNKLSHAETVQRFKAGQYTMSGAEPGHPYILTSCLYNDINIEANTQTSSESTIEISQDILNDVSTHIRFGFYGRSGSTITQQTVWPMFNRGSTPLPWQPYVAPSSALITLTDSLRGIPVSSGGNYTDESGQQWIADYIYRRQTDGKWMLWRNCGETEYDGSEDEAWVRYYQSNTYYAFYIANNKVINAGTTARPADRLYIMCNRYKSTYNTSITLQDLEICTYNNTGNPDEYIYIRNDAILSAEDFKASLQSNPITVVYQLATPTVEELPENVQTELNGLYTYNLHTDMWNSDNAHMALKYVADTKTWINNKIAGLSTAMLNQN